MIRLSERVRLVRADNPSLMTLEGTNTYLVEDGNEVVIIDPGPADARHLDAVAREVGGSRVAMILLTHRHPDHSDGAGAFAAAFGARVGAYGQPGERSDVEISDGDRMGPLTAVHTPGHAGDHLCFLLAGDHAVFSGDHVLGRGTTIIAFPDGDLAAYMDSLARVREIRPARIFPGHGPVLDDPMPVLEEYWEHRLMRERQIIAALATGPGTPGDIVRRVYTDVDPSLHAAAEFNVKAHLDKLLRDGRAAVDGGVWRAP